MVLDFAVLSPPADQDRRLPFQIAKSCPSKAAGSYPPKPPF